MAAIARLNKIWQDQLCKQVHALQVCCHLHPPLRLWITGPACWFWGGKGMQVFESRCMRKLYLLLGAQDQRLGAEQDQLSCGSTGTCSGSRKLETCVVWVYYTPRQPLQTHPPGHLGGLATMLSAENILDWQHQRVDIPAHARTVHKDLLQERLEEDLRWTVPHVPSTTQSVKGLNWTELNCTLTHMFPSDIANTHSLLAVKTICLSTIVLAS